LKREHKVTGVAACLELFKSRPSDIVRAYVTEQKLPLFKKQLRLLAETKRAYHVVAEDELSKIADGSLHAEGVCLLVKSISHIAPLDLLERLEKVKNPKAQIILFLENVENPHNLGALARVVAHFGAEAIVCLNSETSLSARTNAAFYRVAEGGAEATPVCDLSATDLKSFHKKSLSLGFQWMATSSHAKKDIYEIEFATKTILMLGSESQGLSEQMEALAQVHVNIAGTGKVESLNVATAAAVMVAEFKRQTKGGTQHTLLTKSSMPIQPVAGAKARLILKPRPQKD
jgi:RNA methyltransferase, TrmH family